MPSYRTFVEQSAERLLQAETSGLGERPLSAIRALDTETAYKIQDEQFCRRLERGEHGVGIGILPPDPLAAERDRANDPVTGWLTDAMVSHSGARVATEPRQRTEISPHLGFVLGEALDGTGLTAEAAGAAVERVYGALLVKRSRFTDEGTGTSDLIADNLSFSQYLVGGVAILPTAVDLRLEACIVEINGNLACHSTGASLGHPLRLLASAANSLAKRGHALERGWTILMGPVASAVRATPGDTIVASFTHLGSVAVTCVGDAPPR
jgi:2-oxo-3-hexenedioate decarboxylase